jgi:hypothetical protein
VDPRDVFSHPVSKGLVEMVSIVFTRVRGIGILRSSALPWCSEVFCALAHIHSPRIGVWCLRCAAS